MRRDGWDDALKVSADGTGLVGHAGAVLLRKVADQAGLTAWLRRGAAGRRARRPPSTGAPCSSRWLRQSRSGPPA